MFVSASSDKDGGRGGRRGRREGWGESTGRHMGLTSTSRCPSVYRGGKGENGTGTKIKEKWRKTTKKKQNTVRTVCKPWHRYIKRATQ